MAEKTPESIATQFPYTLRRPFFAFFRGLTWAWLLSSAVAAILIPTGLIDGVTGFLIVFIVGGSLWLGIAISAACSRQSLTLFEDRLELQSFGKLHKLLYRDLVDLNIKFTATGRSVMLTLWLEAAAGQPEVPRINLMLFAARDRALLLNTLQARVPGLQFDEVARQVQAGRKFWY